MREAVVRSPSLLRKSARVLIGGALAFLCWEATPAARTSDHCPAGMASVLGRYCIDRYEASLVEVDAGGSELGAHSPYQCPEGKRVKARSRHGAVPQAYVSRNQAERACAEAGKRLCTDDEWLTACRGRQPTTYPYGDELHAGYCNDSGVSPLRHFYGVADDALTFGFDRMNDPRLNQLPGSLAKTGSFPHCRNSFGVSDMVGNLHEWTADKQGTFRGGYYLDTHLNGDGCNYRTTQHSPDYHDYSTGFRCCKSLSGAAGREH